MAHQAHSLPWNTLCSNFQFRRGHSAPGVQHGTDLFPRDDKPDLLKSIEYFARSFQDNLREHATTNRRKHHSREEYARRAQSWTTSKTSGDQARTSADTAADDLSSQLTPDEIRRRRNLELRGLQASLSQDWSAQSETRKVYPDVFHKMFDPYLKTPLSDEWRDIDAWLTEAEPRPIPVSADSQTTFEQCHVIKMLLAAAAAEPSSQTHFIDTLFLLANHPAIDFNYEGLCLQCCNIDTGLGSLMEKIIRCYIYLNMLFVYYEKSMISDGLKVRKGSGPHDSHFEAGVFTYYTSESEMGKDVHRKDSSRYGFNIVPLSTWPAYTRFPTYCRVTWSCCYAHENIADAPIFSPFFFPIEDSSNTNTQRVETDIFANPSALKAFLKKLWKILVLYEMLCRDLDRSEMHKRQLKVNWEYLVMAMFSDLWDWNVKKIFGQYFHEYEFVRWGRNRGLFCSDESMG